MKRKTGLLVAMLLLLATSIAAFGATITVTCTPNPGTSNSVYIIEATWEDTTGLSPTMDDRAPEGTGGIRLQGLGSAGPLGYIPMFYVGGRYRAVVSGGVNMSNPIQQAQNTDFNYMPALYANPRSNDASVFKVENYNSPDRIPFTNRVPYIYPGGYPLWYSSAIHNGGGSGNAQALTFTCVANAWDWKQGKVVGDPVKTDASIVVYTTSGLRNPDRSKAIDYGWVGSTTHPYQMWLYNDMDYLTCYPDTGDLTDPVSVVPSEFVNDMTPDESSGNNQFDFRIRYNNLGGLAPQPWMWWQGGHQSGVVLYFGRKSGPNYNSAVEEDYQAYPMALESGGAVGGVYKFSFVPAAHSTFQLGQRTTLCYSTLEPGIYHYFFGTSDDSMMILPPGEASSQRRVLFSLQPDTDAWGGFSLGNPVSGVGNSNPVDPHGGRYVENYSDIDRLPHRRYSSGRIDPQNGTQMIRYDDTLFVDRVIRAPGLFEDDQTWGFLPTPKYTRTYPFPCNEYPKVTCLIDMRNPARMDYRDADGLDYNDKKYGYARYWGTLQPFKRGVFPILQGDVAVATTQTENIFRIVYRQMDGKAPIKSQVWISNGMGRSGAKPYSMVPDDVLNNKNASLLNTKDYKDGVWYSAKIKLPAGPHSYYFHFSDGLQTSNWPVRPDFDPWVHGSGVSNDVVPGPYINNKSVLSEGAVNPGSGKQGTNFRYTVRYKDADGQRPYNGYVYVETSPGKIRRCEMMPLDKSQVNEANIKGAGVVYYFDTSTVQDLVMQSGQRRFYFEFSDDWGDPSNLNDKIEGEKSRFPSATDSWIQGPEVVSNQAPRLTNGVVKSVDGSATPGTVWNFEVTYSDANNDTPTSLKLYIGQLQRDGKTVIWDEGHAMIEKDTLDSIYNDGKEYYFQTRLGGVDQSTDSEKQYYYVFYAFDGELMATYNSSTDASQRSDAAMAFYRQQLQETDGDNQHFTFEPRIAQRATVVGERTAKLSDATDILRIVGVYGTEDLGAKGGSNFFLAPEVGSGFSGDTVNTNAELPANGSTVWVEYLPASPIFGPALIDQPAAAGVLADAELFAGPTNEEALRIRLDGQKSGWTGEEDGNDLGRFAAMRGTAVDLAGAPTSVTVAPEFPDMIASVEGVYLLAEGDETDPFAGTNYYVPTPENHFHAGDKLIPLTGLTPAYAGKNVLVKYSDIRFTYLQRGVGQNTTPSDIDGTWDSYYIPDSGYNAYIKGNNSAGADPISGLVGVWLNPQRELGNFFDPWLRQYSPVIPGSADRVWLTSMLPAGTGNVYGRYYQYGDYHIDRSNRMVYARSAMPGNNLYATYMFGKRMPVTVGKNTEPVLTSGNVSTYRGSRTTQFVYSVYYTDFDGPNGQQPSFVRVYVDGVAHDMTRESVGTPDYKQGARYLYRTGITTAGSHTFHFEASDGTALAFYDWYNANNETRPTTGQRVREIDGPWINDPPALSGVTMNPSPTAKLGQVVDIAVNYNDADNDEPYFFDAKQDVKADGTKLGQAVSGSPRLWIGKGNDLTANYVVGTINSVSSTDKRVLNITLDSGYTVTTDSLKDSFLQIIPKDQQDYAGRLYLVTNNSSTTLQVRTKNAEQDGIKVGDRFRVNGILMRKTDATDTNYIDGCNYTITLPTLPEGKFKMKMTARSRENKPAWLKETMARNGEQWLPYSDPAAETAVMDLTELVMQRPAGNSAPILTGTVGTSVSQGMPAAGGKIALQHKADVISATKVDLWDAVNEPYNRLYITNVYRYADSIYRTEAARRNGDGYFTPASTPRAYDLVKGTAGGSTVSTEVTLSRPFSAIVADSHQVQLVKLDAFALLAEPDDVASIGSVVGVYADPMCTQKINTSTELVSGKIKIASVPATVEVDEAGNKIGFLVYTAAVSALADVTVTADGTSVTPADAGVMPSIAGIVGVYLNSDTEMSGTNYYLANSFSPGNPSIKLTQALPESKIRIRYLEYPTVYVEYRGGHVEGTSDADRILAAGAPVMLNVDYRDPDSDPPAYHDNVEGFLAVDIANQTHPTKRFSFAMPQPEPQNFTSNVRFEKIFQTGTLAEMLVPGQSTYSFVGSDGYCASSDYVWLPAPSPNGFKIFINKVPTLTDGTVARDTTNGQNRLNFGLSVIYTDGDNQAPTFVKARVRDEDGEVTDVALVKDTSGSSYNQGVIYKGNIQLVVGNYTVIFEASDGVQNVDTSDYAKDLVVSDQNFVPTITEYSLNKASGKLESDFVFSAVYSDADGDSPLVTIGGVAQEGMKLIVTETTSNSSKEFMMRRVGTSSNYRDGVGYSKTLKGSELKSALGWSGKTNYVFTVTASDGVADATKPGLPATKPGPVLNIPYMKTFASVDKDSKIALTRAAVGREILVQGTVAFPYDGSAGAPSIDDMRLIVEVPGGANIGIPASIVNLKLVTGTYKKEWIGDILPNYAGAEPNQDAAVASGESVKLTTGGDWKFRLNWSGNVIWDSLIFDANLDGVNDTPDAITLSVGGPLRTIAVADPGQPASSMPLIDMITPPMYIGNPYSADAGFVFGYEKAIDMQIVRWNPASQTYQRYSVASPLELTPGQAIWVKPKERYAAQAIAAGDINNGLLMSGNLGITLDPSLRYRLISVSAKDYPVLTDNLGRPLLDPASGRAMLQPCSVSLKAGWNQIGNIFYNWKTNSDGTLATPRVDNGIALSSVTVTHMGITKSLADARVAGWIRDYAWRYDAETGKYVLVSASVSGAESSLHVWAGYWIRSLVDCQLTIDPNAAGITARSQINKSSRLNAISIGINGSGNVGGLDVPPPPVFEE